MYVFNVLAPFMPICFFNRTQINFYFILEAILPLSPPARLTGSTALMPYVDTNH